MKKELESGIIDKINNFARTLEKMRFAEYLEYLGDIRKMLIINFLAGLVRGFGMAVGFTLLGALALYFLTRLANENLPIIGDFIAEIVKIVQQHL
jgi:hypothetical protein